LLDRAIATEPRDGSARLARAEIQMVRGNLDKARADCIALSLGVDTRHGILCVAALSFRRGDDRAAANLIDRWLQHTHTDDPQRRFALLMRGETASRGGETDAGRWFNAALAIDRDDVRTLAAYVRHLRRRGRHADIVALLKDAPDTDALHLQHTLAAQALQLPQAAGMSAAQGRRYALAHSLGVQPELRDEADYLLTLRKDPRAALALAQQNFATQRDHEDVELMQRTSAAAGTPAAMRPVERWAASQQLALTAASTAPSPP
ncbi:MAG: tetratricopeptide repeat protein, partial [Luteimonas sp.]